MRTFLYGIGQGFKGLFQNKTFTLAAIGTMTACLFLFGVFYAVLTNFRAMIYNAESSVGITVFFDEGISDPEIEHIGNKIKEIQYVDKTKFISADEAWETFKEEKLEDNPELVETFGNSNPLEDSASYMVTLTDMNKEALVTEAIQKIEGVRKVNSVGAAAGNIGSFNLLVAYISATIIILLFMVSIFLISSAIAMGIQVRKDEIVIMKLIGATDTFVRFPFIVEGIFMGIIGAAIPLVAIYFLYINAIDYLKDHFPAISQWLIFVEPMSVFKNMVPVCAILGIGIGLIGSAFSVRKHLNV